MKSWKMALQTAVDNVRLAAGTFLGNPLRSLLTLLGIVIGVATVVAMMGLIEGLRIKVNSNLADLGANSFQVQKIPRGFGRIDFAKFSKRPNLTVQDREAIGASCPHVLTACAENGEGGQKLVTAQRETNANVSVWAGTANVLETNAADVDAGRMFSESEEVAGRHVVVLGHDTVDVLFPGMNPMGQTVRIKGVPFEVIGTLKRRGSFMGAGSQDNLALFPLSAFHELFGRKRSLNLSIKATSAESMQKAQDEVTTLLRHRRNLKPSDEDNFFLFSNESSTATFNNISNVVTAASFGICFLALIVGGIGILNIMLVSVTERTREIGLRKALGARRRRILGQFATEAVALALIGGILGVLLGVGLSTLGRWMLNVPTEVPLWAVGVSLGMSSVVGLVFGIYPAVRAARLDPVEAMRTE